MARRKPPALDLAALLPSWEPAPSTATSARGAHKVAYVPEPTGAAGVRKSLRTVAGVQLNGPVPFRRSTETARA
jgi:hypothetical protein